ncbi:hypothetical protein [Paraburkholderia sp.]|uniref:hypothetical protein n=1 Tax=Paraburkholderia sp. TaxID=1926495 RepID=UPI0039E41D16
MEKLYLIVRGSFSEGFRFSLPMTGQQVKNEYGSLMAASAMRADLVEITPPDGGIEDRSGRSFLVRGDPILEGFEAIGPFTNIQDATAYGIAKEEGNWWVFMASGE